MVCVWNGKSAGQWTQEQRIHGCCVDAQQMLEQKAASRTKEQDKMYLELKGMFMDG